MKCSLVISNFLEELSSLSQSFAFLYFFALIAEEVEVEQFYEDLQDLLELTPKKMSFSLYGTGMQN